MPDFHSLEAIEQAIAELQPLDVVQLRRYSHAARLVFNSRNLSEDELIDEAVARSLEGARQWNVKLTIVQHLFGVMKSLASDQHRTKVAKAEVLLEDILGEDEDKCTEEALENNSQFSIELIMGIFEDDEKATAVLKALCDGDKRSQTILNGNLTAKEYDTARKRITRKMLQMKEKGQL